MRSSSETPLNKEEQFAANLAMAARKETDQFKAGLAQSLQIKMWCIERGIDAARESPFMSESSQGNVVYYPEELARLYYRFLNE